MKVKDGESSIPVPPPLVRQYVVVTAGCAPGGSSYRPATSKGTAQRTRGQRGTYVSFKCSQLLPEQMLGERHRPIVREDAIDVLDDVRTTRADDAAGSAEARVRQRIFEAIRGCCSLFARPIAEE